MWLVDAPLCPLAWWDRGVPFGRGEAVVEELLHLVFERHGELSLRGTDRVRGVDS